jgi:hypothetical protein
MTPTATRPGSSSAGWRYSAWIRSSSSTPGCAQARRLNHPRALARDADTRNLQTLRQPRKHTQQGRVRALAIRLPFVCSGARVVTSAIRPESETIPCASALEGAGEAHHARPELDATPRPPPAPDYDNAFHAAQPCTATTGPDTDCCSPTEASARLAPDETPVARPEQASRARERIHLLGARSGARSRASATSRWRAPMCPSVA